MPTFIRPQPTGQTSVAEIQTGSSSTAALGIAQTTSRLGGEVAELGAEYLEKSQQALSTSIYTVHMNKALNRFTKVVEDRQSQVTDDDGNPTTGTMAEDVREEGQKIMAQQSALIADENAYSQFRKDFQSNISSQTARTANVAAKKEREFEIAATQDAIQTAIDSSVSSGNFQVANNELSRVKKVLASQVQAGNMTPIHSQELLDGARETVMKSIWAERIRKDPEAAKEYLTGKRPMEQLGVSSTGLDAIDKKDFVRQAEETIVSDRQEEQRIQEEYEGRVSDWQTANYEDLENNIVKGDITTQAEIEALRASGIIDTKQETKAIRTLRTERRRATENVVNYAEVSKIVKNGSPTQKASIPPSEANKWYQQSVSKGMEAGNRTEEQTRTSAAARLEKPVKEHTTWMDVKANSTDPEAVMEGFKSYAKLQKSQATKGVTANLSEQAKNLYSMMQSRQVASLGQAQAVMEEVNNLRTKTPDQVEALNDKADQAMDPDSDVADPNFKNRDSIDNWIRANVQEQTGEDTLGVPYFGEDSKINPGVRESIKKSFRQMYIATGGDAEATKERIKNEVLPAFGTTSVLGGDNQIVSFPPEKMLGLNTQEKVDKFNKIAKESFGDDLPPNATFTVTAPIGMFQSRDGLAYSIQAVGDDGSISLNIIEFSPKDFNTDFKTAEEYRELVKNRADQITEEDKTTEKIQDQLLRGGLN